MRFLSDLVNCHVIAAPSMVAMFENFVSVTQEEDVPQVCRRWRWNNTIPKYNERKGERRLKSKICTVSWIKTKRTNYSSTDKNVKPFHLTNISNCQIVTIDLRISSFRIIV